MQQGQVEAAQKEHYATSLLSSLHLATSLVVVVVSWFAAAVGGTIDNYANQVFHTHNVTQGVADWRCPASIESLPRFSEGVELPHLQGRESCSHTIPRR